MDLGHLHLMLNHLPVLGIPTLLTVLVWGLARHVPTVARGALWLTVALGVVTVAVYLTGEAAEEMVEGLPTFEESLVERHETWALWTTVTVVLTGVLAAGALWRRSRALIRLVVVMLALSTGALGLTAWSGGPIGHPELRSQVVSGGAISEDDD